MLSLPVTVKGASDQSLVVACMRMKRGSLKYSAVKQCAVLDMPKDPYGLLTAVQIAIYANVTPYTHCLMSQRPEVFSLTAGMSMNVQLSFVKDRKTAYVQLHLPQGLGVCVCQGIGHPTAERQGPKSTECCSCFVRYAYQVILQSSQ